MEQIVPKKVLDTKTIEVTEFMFRTEGLPAWFMVGKEIMPNAKGHIVPVFDKSVCPNFGKYFRFKIYKNIRLWLSPRVPQWNGKQCTIIFQFSKIQVILRLPDPLDIKDVFWFAVRSNIWFFLKNPIPNADILDSTRNTPFAHLHPLCKLL